MPTKIVYWHAEKFSQKEVHNLTVIERTLLTISLRLTPRLVTATIDLANNYASVFGLDREKIAIVPNWVEPVEVDRSAHRLLIRQLSLSTTDKVVLFVHRLSPRKGAHLLPKIASLLETKIPNARLLIIGGGPLLSELNHHFASNPRVSVLGPIPQQQVISYYQLADILLMPSLREGFPRVIIEAMAHKIPIVATKTGSTEYIVGSSQHSFLVSKPSPTLLVEKIAAMLEMPSSARRKLIEENYDKVVTEYSLSIATQAMIECVK